MQSHHKISNRDTFMAQHLLQVKRKTPPMFFTAQWEDERLDNWNDQQLCSDVHMSISPNRDTDTERTELQQGWIVFYPNFT